MKDVNQINVEAAVELITTLFVLVIQFSWFHFVCLQRFRCKYSNQHSSGHAHI